MLKLSLIEFLLRSIPEVSILIYGINVITRKYFGIYRYIASCIVLAAFSFIVRLLPIYFGVHTIICIIFTIGMTFLLGVPLIKSIHSTFLMSFVLSVSEWLNILILSRLNIDVGINNLDPLLKVLYGIPSLVFVFLFVVLINHVLNRK